MLERGSGTITGFQVLHEMTRAGPALATARTRDHVEADREPAITIGRKVDPRPALCALVVDDIAAATGQGCRGCCLGQLHFNRLEMLSVQTVPGNLDLAKACKHSSDPRGASIHQSHLHSVHSAMDMKANCMISGTGRHLDLSKQPK